MGFPRCPSHRCLNRVARLGNPDEVIGHETLATRAAHVYLLACHFHLHPIWRRRAIAVIAVAALWSVLAHAWLASNDIPSRFEMLRTDLQYSVSANVSAGLTGIYAWWGPWWLLVILLALMSGKKGIFPFLIGAVALPGVLTIITVDGTRVFASIAAPIGVAMALSYLGASGLTEKKPQVQAPLTSANSLTNSIALWACALVLLPALMSNVGASTFLSNWQFVVTQVTDRLQ